MVLEIESARGAMTGARYVESLNDNREVWLDGAKVTDVAGHPAMTGMVHELARIYDLQHSDEYRDQMTFVSPDTGNRCSLSWLLPRTREDLKQQRDATAKSGMKNPGGNWGAARTSWRRTSSGFTPSETRWGR